MTMRDTATNPIYSVIHRWCMERNRETHVVVRVCGIALAAAGCSLDHPWWMICLAGLLAFGLSFVLLPVQVLHIVVTRSALDYVPDRLLMLIAESRELDAETKAELATMAARFRGLCWFQLAEAAAGLRASTEHAARLQSPGYVALTRCLQAPGAVDESEQCTASSRRQGTATGAPVASAPQGQQR